MTASRTAASPAPSAAPVTSAGLSAPPPPEPEVVVVNQGPEHPWVGQAVRFDVQLVRPIQDAGSAPPFSFAEVTIPGAIARFQEQAPPPDERTSGAFTLLVQHRTLLVFPQLDGDLTLPPLVARWNEGEDVLTAASKPAALHAAYAPGASEDLVVSPSVRIEQTLSRPLSGLRVGDGFTRKIVLTVTDSDPIVLPTLEFAPAPGLSLHPAAPRDSASAERGAITASRTFEATYVVECVGHYDLDKLQVRWLEPRTGKYHQASAPELSFWALPNPSLGLHMWGSAPLSQVAGFGLALLLLVGSAALAVRRVRGGPFRWERRLRARRAEKHAFRQFLRSVTVTPPLESLRLAYVWLRARAPSKTDRTLQPLRTGNPEAARGLDLLEAGAFNSESERKGPAATRGAFTRAREGMASGQSVPFRLNPTASAPPPQPESGP